MRKVRCRSQRSGARRATINAENAEEQRGAEQAPRVTALRAGWAEEAAIANATDTFLSRLRIAAVLGPPAGRRPASPVAPLRNPAPRRSLRFAFPRASARRSLRRPAPHGWIQPPHAAAAMAFAPESGHADSEAPNIGATAANARHWL